MKNLNPFVASIMALLLIPLLFTSTPAQDAAADAPIQFVVDKAHTEISFKVKHLGIAWVKGSFSDFEIDVNFDPENHENLMINTTIDVASISTRNEKRDGHLMSPDFFDAAKFPKMTFVSKNVTKVDDSNYKITGDLTIRDVTKEVVLDFAYYGMVTTPWGSTNAAGTATTMINRMEYGLAWDKAIETGSLIAGDEVFISIDIEIMGQ